MKLSDLDWDNRFWSPARQMFIVDNPEWRYTKLRDEPLTYLATTSNEDVEEGWGRFVLMTWDAHRKLGYRVAPGWQLKDHLDALEAQCLINHYLGGNDDPA
jgi:hypothetical protein